MALILAGRTLGAEEQKSDGDHLLQARRHLAAARVSQKFAVVQHGNPRAIEETLDSLAAADRELAAIPPEDAGIEAARLTAQAVQSVRSRTEQIKSVTGGTFYGQFPLVHAFEIRKPEEGELSVSYSIRGTARRPALRTALLSAMAEVPADIAIWSTVLVVPDQHGVAPAPDLLPIADTETALYFGTLPYITMLSDAWREALPPTPAWDAPDTDFIPHCRALMARIGNAAQSANLLFVLVREVDSGAAENHWLQVQVRLFKSRWLAPLLNPEEKTLETYEITFGDGLRRQSSQFFWPVVWINVALAALALAIYAAFYFAWSETTGTWRTWLIPPLFGYALGLLLPLTTVPALKGIAPPPTSAAITSAWWPTLAGALMLLVPGIVCRVSAGKLGGFIGGLYLDGRWGAALSAAALGVVGFWCRPAFVVLGASAIDVLIPFGVASVLVMFLFGRSIDGTDRISTAVAPLAALLAAPIGLGIFWAAPWVLWATAVAAAALIAGCEFHNRHEQSTRQRKKSLSPVTLPGPGDLPRTVAELRTRAMSPAYYPVQALNHARTFLERAKPDQTMWLGLCGSSGSGKTAVAQRLIHELQASAGNVQVLSATCRPDAAPYQPVREAMTGVWSAIATLTAQPQGGKFDSVMQEVVQVFVPFWGLLSSYSQSASATAASKSDLFAAVSAALRRLARKNRLVLFLDDVQWIDAGSAELLRYLQERFPTGGDLPIVVVLSSRDDAKLRALGLEESTLRIQVPPREEQIAILTRGLRIAPESAARIINSLGIVEQESGGLFWLCRTIVELVDAGAIVESDEGFKLRDDFDASGQLPVPAELRQLLAARLRESADHQRVLECAAILGQEFRASDVVEALKLDRLELLETLRTLEREHRVVRDIPHSDDHYAFSSTFMLEVVRQEFEIPGSERAGAQAPKIVQELHARLAAALEARSDRSPLHAYELAKHSYLAGKRHAAASYKACLDAARAARTEFAFEQARRYLAMGRDSSQSTDDLAAVDFEQQLVDCDEAHITGRNRVQAAQRGVDFVRSAKAPSAILTAAVARACYDAGRDSGDTAWFRRAAELSQQMLKHAHTPVEQATAHHLLGISLPLEESAVRIKSLRTALTILERMPQSDHESLLLTARVLGSLGEQLSVLGPAEQRQARELLEKGLSLRQEHRVGDLPGQARAHGGLGRLAFYASPPDYAAAKHHFSEDLRISEEIGDAVGQALSHSFLAACERAEGNLAAALEHYRESQKHAVAPRDLFFALSGSLEVLAKLDKADEAEQVGRQILTVADGNPIPTDCAEELARVLASCGPKLRGDWTKTLAARVSSHVAGRS